MTRFHVFRFPQPALRRADTPLTLQALEERDLPASRPQVRQERRLDLAGRVGSGPRVERHEVDLVSLGQVFQETERARL